MKRNRCRKLVRAALSGNKRAKCIAAKLGITLNYKHQVAAVPCDLIYLKKI